MKLRCHFVLAIILLVPLLSPGADEGQQTNMVEEIKQLRLRTEALEKKLSDTKPVALSLGSVSAGSSYMNASFDVLFNAGWSSTPDTKEIQPGCHDPSQRGFSIRNAELALDGAVDPYFKAFANIVFMTDFEEETQLELEEAYALSSSLHMGYRPRRGGFTRNLDDKTPNILTRGRSWINPWSLTGCLVKTVFGKTEFDSRGLRLRRTLRN